jgi:hypothetical protein
MASVFACAARHRPLGSNHSVSGDSARNTEFTGGFFVRILPLGPLTKNELRADVGQCHDFFLSQRA